MIETQNELTSKKKGKLQEGMLEYFPENQASKRAGICQLKNHPHTNRKYQQDSLICALF